MKRNFTEGIVSKSISYLEILVHPYMYLVTLEFNTVLLYLMWLHGPLCGQWSGTSTQALCCLLILYFNYLSPCWNKTQTFVVPSATACGTWGQIFQGSLNSLSVLSYWEIGTCQLRLPGFSLLRLGWEMCWQGVWETKTLYTEGYW